MKRIAAILLLILFLFNIAGYRALSFYLSQKADTRIEARLNDPSNQEGFITFKIPLHLPYLTDQDNFEPAEGEVTVSGEIYKLVKKKISRDTLFVICIDHKEKTRIARNDNDYFKKVNDQTPGNSKKADVKPLKTDYLLEEHTLAAAAITVFHETLYKRFPVNSLLPGYVSSLSSPPEQPLS